MNHLRRLGSEVRVSLPKDEDGLLGRECPNAECESHFKIQPSDYSGVIFVSFDKGGLWNIRVAKEMRAACLKVDLNKL